MVTVEIVGAHGIPRDSINTANDLQQVIHCRGKIIILNEIKSNSRYMYAHIVIGGVN